jgi:hypothetical protein
MNRSPVQIIFLLYLSCTCSFAQSTAPSWENDFSRGEYLQIKLVTIDPGDELTMWWGHTALIVEDLRFHTSLFYNYGIFSFEQENFMRNFAMGRLIFWVGAWNTEGALNYYKSLDRTIRMQILDFPPERRLQLARFLDQNVLPQNRQYLYNHYDDNCSTRIRDLIDKMVDGQLAQSCGQAGRMTLRQHTRRHTHQHFWMDLLLMFLMNDTIDKPVTRWQEMFLPTELERNVQNLTLADSSGVCRKLVAENLLFFEGSERPPVPEFAPQHWPVTLALGGFLAMLGLYLAFLYQNQAAAGKYLFGIYHGLLGLICGLAGLALFFMANFTDHTVTYHNENLYLANPLTLLLIFSGMAIIRNGPLKQKFTLYLSCVLAALSILALAFKVFPAYDQDNWDIIALLLPIWLTLAGSWLWINKKSCGGII